MTTDAAAWAPLSPVERPRVITSGAVLGVTGLRSFGPDSVPVGRVDALGRLLPEERLPVRTKLEYSRAGGARDTAGAGGPVR